MSDDLRSAFHDELESIRQGIVRMAAHVSESIPRGTHALLDNDLEAAQDLIEADDELDALSLELEERCYRVLALQNPMAADLRRITTALWMNAEIERSGDLMVNIAKAVRRIYGASYDPHLRGIVVQMSEEAGRLFRLAVDSYVEGNEGLAAALDDIDDRLDNLNRECIQAIFEGHRHGYFDLEAAVQLALIGRYYERIGDHAVNMGERVVYMATGWLPEHTGAARAASRHRVHEEAAEDESGH
ncbi:MAG: phosphate signaling complex protein PhoU [Acidimicrobiales bacterium]|nr:phosphate signaling complex protein PhoU [Acidimicrobiales bacterium]